MADSAPCRTASLVTQFRETYGVVYRRGRSAVRRAPSRRQFAPRRDRCPQFPGAGNAILRRSTALAAIAGIAIVGVLYACGARRGPSQSLITGDAASKVYVAPGSYDEFYSFLSGGYSGQVAVYGLPSGRLLKLIPVFSQFPEDGYGYNEETKPLLQTTYGFMPWDDSHHPELSKTDGVPDGRWLFINGEQHAAHRAHRSHALRDRRDHPDPELGRRTRVAVHDAGHQVRRLGDALQRADPEHRRPDRQLQEELQGHAVVHHGRPAGQDGHRVPDPDARLQLRPRPRGQGSVRRLVLLHVVQQRAGEHQARGERVAERQGLHRRGELQARRGVRRAGQGEAGGRPSTTTTGWTRARARRSRKRRRA